MGRLGSAGAHCARSFWQTHRKMGTQSLRSRIAVVDSGVAGRSQLAYTSARAVCRPPPGLLAIVPFVPSARAVARWGCQLRAGHRHTTNIEETQKGLHMEAHHLLRRAVWAGLAAAATATTAHAQVDHGVRGGAAGAGRRSRSHGQRALVLRGRTGRLRGSGGRGGGMGHASTWMAAPAVTCSPRSAVLRRQ